MIDVSDSTSPVLVGDLDFGNALNTPLSLAVSGGYAYVVDQSSNDLKVIDVSTPAAPILANDDGTGLGFILGGSPRSIAVSGSYAYVVDQAFDDLKIIDVDVLPVQDD